MTLDWLIKQELIFIEELHQGMMDLLGGREQAGQASRGYDQSLYRDGTHQTGNIRRKTLSFASLLKAGPGKADAMFQAALKGQ